MKENTFTHGGFKIEEVVVLNLEHRFDKKWAMVGALLNAGCPLDRIRIWNAVPGNVFENRDDLGAAASTDGFPWFKDFVGRMGNDLRSLKILSQAWSYCQMLRHLSENNINGLILYDDRYIVDFEQLSAVTYFLRELDAKDETFPFRMLQCDYYDNIRQDLRWTPQLHKKLPYIIEGPAGASENAIFYTSQGAGFFLNYVERALSTKEFNNAYPTWTDPSNIETALSMMSHLPASERMGVWTAYNCRLVDHVKGFGSDIRVGQPQYENIIGDRIKTAERQACEA